MRRSLLTVAVTVVAMLMTSVDRSVSGEVVTCPQECRCGVVSGAPSADCSGRHITDLSDVIARLHPDTQVSVYVHHNVLEQILCRKNETKAF